MDTGTLLLTTTFEVSSVQFTIGDVLGFVTGLICVWLTAKASIWNFAWGILNSIILGIVFLDQRLFADSALQIVFIVLALQGWLQWRAGRHTDTQGFRTTRWREQASLVGVAAALTLLLWCLLVRLRGSAPPMDALITALSLCAQWQLNRRQVASWFWWITVDLLSIPLYWSRDLVLIAGLYVIFLVICLHGLRNWRKIQCDINATSNSAHMNHTPFQHGLVTGKFYPPHLGHEYLIRSAALHSSGVTVVVLGASLEKLTIAQRVQWLQNAFADRPKIRIVGAPDDVPVDYDDDSIWQAHVDIMRGAVAEADQAGDPYPRVDAVFSSEIYGDRLASYFHCPHVCLDQSRNLYPTSGTAVRADLTGQWHMLSPSVQAGLVMRVVVLGAESTGTTTLSRDLAGALFARGGLWSRSLWVPEYGREYSVNLLALAKTANSQACAADIRWQSSDFTHVAQEQCRRENRAAAHGSPVLVCDTDAWVTRIWHERYMGTTSAAVDAVVAEMPARALYILTSELSVPFDDDGLRDGSHLRTWMNKRFREELSMQSVPWIEVHGGPEMRCQIALNALNTLIRYWTFASPPAPADNESH